MKRMVVADVPTGTVARRLGYWGVMGKWTRGSRRFDRWDAPAIRLYAYDEVVVSQNVRPMGKGTIPRVALSRSKSDDGLPTRDAKAADYSPK